MMFRWCLLIFGLFSVFSAQGGGGSDCDSLLAGISSVRLKSSFRIPQRGHTLFSFAETKNRLILMEKTTGSLFTNGNVIKFFDREAGYLKNRFQERLPQVSFSHFPSPYPNTRNGKIIKLNKIDGGMKSPLIIVNDQVVVVSDDGYLYTFDKDGEIRNRLGHGHIERILNVNNSTITVC